MFELHGIGTKGVRYKPLSQKEMMDKLGWNQSKVHRAMKEVFGEKPMEAYKRCFATGKLTGYMKKLEDGNYEVNGIVEPEQ